MYNGSEHKLRAIEVLERMGFFKIELNDSHEEWILKDDKTGSVITIEFRYFEVTDAKEKRGMWVIVPWAGIHSEEGGPLTRVLGNV